MELFRQFQVFLIAATIFHTWADVTLTAISTLGVTSINGQRIPVKFECNTKVTLVCKIEPYVDTAIWQINGTRYALCIFQSCLSYPPFPENHNFSMDLTSEVFNLTVDPVPFFINGSIYNCNDGQITRSLEAVIEVYSNSDTLKLDTSAEKQITVTTGCVYPRGREDILFSWFITKDKQTLEPKQFKSKKNEITNIFGCTETSSCAGETANFNNTVTFDVFKNGVEYFICVNVTHADRPPAVDCTERAYKVEVMCKILCGTVCILLIVNGICIIIDVIVGCFLLNVMLRPRVKEDNTEDKWSTSNLEILLNTLSAILWIEIASSFIWSLLHCCRCENTCKCCDIVLQLRIGFGILFGIHLILWLILLYVLYNRKDKGDNEGDIHCKTKLEKVRIIFSTIPFVGLFPVCGWLIRIYRCGNRTIHDKQLITEKKKPQLASITEQNLTNPKTAETGKQNSKRDKKELNKINQSLNQAVSSNENDDEVSASGVIIVKTSGTDTVEYSRSSTSVENSTKHKAFMKADSEDKTNKEITLNTKYRLSQETDAFTNSGTKQLSQTNGNVIASSQEHNTEHENNVSDNPNHVPYYEEKPQRKVDVTKTKTGSENKPGSKDDVIRKKKKSRKAEDENKNPENTNMVSAEAHTGNMDVTKMKTRSENKPGSKDDVTRARKKSRKAEDENKNPQNTNMVSAEAHTANIDVAKTGFEEKLGSSGDDTVLPTRKKSRKETNENKNSQNTKPVSAESHNGSETMKRALSANFHDEQDVTTTVSIDSTTKM